MGYRLASATKPRRGLSEREHAVGRSRDARSPTAEPEPFKRDHRRHITQPRRPGMMCGECSAMNEIRSSHDHPRLSRDRDSLIGDGLSVHPRSASGERSPRAHRRESRFCHPASIVCTSPRPDGNPSNALQHARGPQAMSDSGAGIADARGHYRRQRSLCADDLARRRRLRVRSGGVADGAIG